MSRKHKLAKVDKVRSKDQHQFGYDVIATSHKRKQSSPNLRSEDQELISGKRRLLQAQARDIPRNIAIGRWAIGKHLDFVSRFKFSSQTKTDWDTAFQNRMNRWMNNPAECDIRRQHTFARILRMTEARAVIDGDHLLVRLSGQKLQQIESDRIRNGPDADENTVQGFRQDEFGATIAYQVHKRGKSGSGYEFQNEISADDAMLHAYFPSERADQTRGVGLIVAAIADLLDSYEWMDSAKLAEKARALIAMVFSTTAAEGYGESKEWAPNKYKVDMGRGPVKVELEPGDSFQMVGSQMPASQTVAFFNGIIGSALKALDIPLCFYDETLTNFFGQRAQFILYIESCKSKRDNLRTNILHPLTYWLARCWVADGSLPIPPVPIHQLPFQWRAAGLPWWNPLQDATANLMTIGGGLGNYEDIYLETTGDDWYENIDKLAEQQAYIKKKGVVLNAAHSPIAALLLQQQQQDQQKEENPLSQLPTPKDLAI